MAGIEDSLEVFLESVLTAMNQTNRLQAETNVQLEQFRTDRIQDRKRIEELTELIKGNGKPGLRQRVDTLEVSVIAHSNDFYGKEQSRDGVFYRFTDWEKRWSWVVWPLLVLMGGATVWFVKLLGEFLFNKVTGG